MRSGFATIPWVHGARAVALLATTAAAVALGAGLAREPLLSNTYFWHNSIDDSSHHRLLLWVASATAIGGLAALAAWAALASTDASGHARLWDLAQRVSPLGPLAFVPSLLRWQLWQGHDLTFLLATLVVALSAGATVSAALRAGPAESSWSAALISHFGCALIIRAPGRRVWLWIVASLSLAYILWFAYYTSVWHQCVRSGYDTAGEDNILWNMSHGGPFFKAAPVLGPVGSHFRRHATLISYVFVPLYLIRPGAATLLVLQSVVQGLAAIPLFLFARRRIGERAAALVAALYLLHPALQQSNLFEVHYVKFGAFFLWTTLWLLDSGKHRWALLAAFLTLTLREDVATWVILLGLWGLFNGRSPRTSSAIALVGAAYVGIVKFVIMPSFGHGEDELTFMYTGLIPSGKHGFGWVLATALGNPAFTLESLLELNKVVFFLQVLVPIALMPLRRAIGWFALIPGGLFCFLSTHYGPLVDIHFQYSAHLLAFLFPALVLVLEDQERSPALQASGHASAPPTDFRERSARRLGALVSLAVATLVCSYQYGAVFQQNTSRGGPLPYKFGWDEEGHVRRRAVDALLQVVPARAKIAASAFTVTQVSARPDAYSLSLGLYDAEWLIAPSEKSEYVGDELARTIEALRSGGFGVVRVEAPFFVARRGAPDDLNAELLSRLGPR
jgi:uncharacterized membrane protein